MVFTAPRTDNINTRFNDVGTTTFTPRDKHAVNKPLANLAATFFEELPPESKRLPSFILPIRNTPTVIPAVKTGKDSDFHISNFDDDVQVIGLAHFLKKQS